MKFLLGLIVALMIASSAAVPVNNPSDEVENIEVSYPETNLEEADSGPGFSFLAPLPISPYSFFDSVEEYFRNIRQKLLSRFIDVADALELDPSKGNTTSTTKIINGHKVEINNTVYVDNNENGDGVIKVRVLHIRPLDVEDASTPTSADNSLKDTDEKTSKPLAEGTTATNSDLDNEIDPTTKISSTSDVETLFDLITEPNHQVPDEMIKSSYSVLRENIQPLYYETKTDNQDHNSNEEIDLYQLADSQTSEPAQITNEEKSGIEILNTTKVESISEELDNNDQNTEKIISESEVEPLDIHNEETQTEEAQPTSRDSDYKDDFESSEGHQITHLSFNQRNSQNKLYKEEWALSDEDYDNNYDNDIDGYESIPVDLSNDINVNYIAKQNGAIPDPDAEFIIQENLSDYKIEMENLPYVNLFTDSSSESTLDDDDVPEREIPIK